MTTAPPPGWYADPRGLGLRYWEGERWSEHILPHGTTPPLIDDPHPGAARTPRRTSTRVILTVALMVSAGVLAGLVSNLAVELFAALVGPLAPSTREDLVQSGAQIVVAALAGWAGTKVSYRWFDFLMLLIPFYGILWAFRIAWRISYLPYRDWPPLDRRPRAGASSATRLRPVRCCTWPTTRPPRRPRPPRPPCPRSRPSSPDVSRTSSEPSKDANQAA